MTNRYKFYFLFMIFLNLFTILPYSNQEFTNYQELAPVKEKLETSTIPIKDYEWLKIWNINDNENPNAMAIDSMDDIIIVGQTYYKSLGFILKYNKYGDLLWNLTLATGTPRPRDVIVDSENNIYVSGVIYTGIYILFVKKYSPNGALIWEIEISDEEASPSDSFLILDSYEYLYLGGIFDGFYNYLVLVRLNSNTGSRIWTTTYIQPTDNKIYELFVNFNDNAVAGIRSSNKTTSIVEFDRTSGDLISSHRIGNLDIIYDMEYDSKGNIYTVTLDNSIYRLMKFNLTGILQWEIGMNNQIELYDVAFDSTNGLYVTSDTYNIMKFTEFGESVWNCTYSGDIDENIKDIALDSMDDIYYTGKTGPNCFTIKYNKSPPRQLDPLFVEKNLYALVIGIEDYPGTDNDLLYCGEDASRIISYLKGICNVKSENIKTKFDSGATETGINNAINNIKSVIKPYDTLFFYYSGHGMLDAFCPYDTMFYLYTTLDQKLDSINCSEKVLLFDACHSGCAANDIDGDNLYILTACRPNELSVETSDFYGGVFTNYFLESRSKVEDQDLDNIISLEEQFPYILQKTSSYCSNFGIEQHPMERDYNDGPTKLNPCLSNLDFGWNGKILDFSFELRGSGEIYLCNVTINDDLDEKEYDFSNYTSSITGFGGYNGKIPWDTNTGELNCKLEVLVKGESVKKLTYTLTLFPPSPNNISAGILFLFFMVISLSFIFIMTKRRITL
ncbi:MAG: caspase family protein [Promethearchaeota archaeon]|nr:MAG: caspase family protein [Candidatus Lokiarchaeota archaeon]